MATLQTIRKHSGWLVAIIGLALFAFIAGDAAQVLQPHQNSQLVGEINGNKIDAQQYQKLLDEYTEVTQLMRGTTSFSEAEMAQIKDAVWNTLVSSMLLEAETSKLGLTVTAEELQTIIEKGTDPLLAQTPFQNPATGKFDGDVLMRFLADYQNLDTETMPAEYIEYYNNLYKYWKLVEKELRSNLLVQKYEALVAGAQLSNPVAAQYNFDARNNSVELAYVAIPFTSIADSLVKVSNADIKKVYNEKKEMYKQVAESRDIKYIDIEVLPSQADREELLKELNEYADQLATSEELATLIRLAESTVSYSEVPRTISGLPSDVAARIDSASMNVVYGPYYNAADDSYNAFKLIAKTTTPDSIQYRQIQIADADAKRAKELADSIYPAIRTGAKFAEIAAKYNQEGEPIWLTSAQYETGANTGDNAIYLNTLNGMRKNELKHISLSGVELIIEVVDTKNPVEKYHAAIIKRPAYFSNDTYNAEYNRLSAFVASNQTLSSMEANAEEEGFRLLNANNLQNSAHTIGGVENTRTALRWAFEAEKDEVSHIFEVGANNHLIVCAVADIHESGYRPVEDMTDLLRFQALNNKKAEKILADAQNVKSIQEALAINGAKADTLRRVNFNSPAYLSKVPASEAAISGAAASLEPGTFSGPIKGNSAIYFIEVIKANKGTSKFDEAKEKETLINTLSRNINGNRLLQELYTKGDVVDNRYLFF